MHPEMKRFSVPWYIILLIVVGALLGAGAIYNQLGLRNDNSEIGIPGTRTSNGLHVYAVGEKTHDNQPSVLLLGGWGTVSPFLDYLPLAHSLRDNVRVIAVERPGYGFAGTSFSERTLDNMVEEMRAGLNELGERAPYVIAAHTTAGLEAIHYAALYPDEIDGIVFINALSPGAYYYEPLKFLDYVKVFTYPVPKYTGIFRVIGLFNQELFLTGSNVEPDWYAAQYYKNVMSRGMRAELFKLRENAKTALLHGSLEVESVAFVDSVQFYESNPELQRVWSEYFGKIIETDVGSYIHGFETGRVAREIMTLVDLGTQKIRPEPDAEPDPVFDDIWDVDDGSDGADEYNDGGEEINDGVEEPGEEEPGEDEPGGEEPVDGEPGADEDGDADGTEDGEEQPGGDDGEETGDEDETGEDIV